MKVFEDIPIIDFKKWKCLRTSLWEPKCLHQKSRRVSMVPAIDEDEQFVNILLKHISLNHHLKCIYSIRPQNLNRDFKNVVYLCSCKTTIKIHRKHWVDLIITDVRIGAFHGIKKLTKNHFALTSRKAFPKEKVIGK